MYIQRIGENLVIVLPIEVIQEQNLQEGDTVIVTKNPNSRAFAQALQQVMHDYAPTFEYLKDK